MIASLHSRWLPAVCLLGVLAGPVLAADPQPLCFRVTFDPAVSPQPFTGRVFVMLLRNPAKEPRSQISWYNPEPTFALDVRDWKPGQPITLGPEALAFPKQIHELPPGKYHLQAIMDFDQGGRSFANAVGNGYSPSVLKELDPKSCGPVELRIDQTVKPRPFTETERVKLVEIDSKLLTAFHGRPQKLRAGVVLPKSFAEQPQRQYPVLYEIPGFGGNHRMALNAGSRDVNDIAGVEMIRVYLDPDCRWGHSVFADSANNGPWGQALVEELIPHLEAQYRGWGVPTARFVTGHSSGGWSSLWLQVAYPHFFGGTWSTAPDPVDFRDFQKVNIYEPGSNVYEDAKGQPRPLARNGGKVMIYWQPFTAMEQLMGHGGQLGSFEAVFSPRGEDGRPKPLWNRDTGKVDPAVAKHWEKYDLRLVLERNWATLGPQLQGKLHIYMGMEDNYYLEGAVVLLKQSLQQLGSDAVVELYPGRDHGTLINPELRQRIYQDMAQTFRRHHPAE
jgi:S-formylglutathione hydrolase FrmB